MKSRSLAGSPSQFDDLVSCRSLPDKALALVTNNIPDSKTEEANAIAYSPATQTSKPSAGLRGWWQVFASTYVTIFFAEIGDKTQVTTLLMSAESHKPWMVFAGAGTALVCTSLLGVLLGRWLATRLAPRTLEVGAGITLLIITAGLGLDILQAF